MTLEHKILELKIAIVGGVSYLFEKIATKFFNYPQNQGMLIDNPDLKKMALSDYISSLPYHKTVVPPQPMPKNLIEVFFGNFPSTSTIEKVFYEHITDGYYNFYVENYRNIYFLPDWLSQWIQIHFDISVDTTMLEIIREGIFLSLLGFMFLMQFRLNLYWFLTINPYTRPWVYFISLTDWVFDAMAGFSPVILGLDLSGSIILGLTGKLADTLNHLVLTMPFLPSEGQPGKLMIEGQLKDVILFRYLPSLWYTHPIPDDLREFWYTERPEIYQFLKKNYGHLDIEFLPNRILKEIYDHHQSNKSLAENFEVIKNLSNQLVCDAMNYCEPFTNSIFQKKIILVSLFLQFMDKLTF
jgi:hypothetical protein